MVRSARLAIGVGLVIGLSGGCAGAVRPTGRVASSEPVLNDFQTRVAQYMKLHRELSDGVPEQKESVNVAGNQASAHTLAARIRAARVNARQGDIFAPPIAARVRQLLNPEVRGRGHDATETRAVIRDDAPAKFTLGVNDAYPAGASLPTVPGNVLAALPPLPAGLEYRIVDRHLILRDVRANIVVDYIFDVMCGTC